MAAVRSALMGLCRRRCGRSGCSAAASMVARGLGMRQGAGAAATRTPALPSLRSSASRNLEGWRPFSTEGMEGACHNKPLLMKHKVESILRMWCQRSRDSVKNVTKDSTLVATSISFLTTFCLLRLTFCSSTDTKTKSVHFHHPNAFASSINAFASSTNTGTEPADIRTNVHPYLESPLPMAFALIPGLRGIYISSRCTVHDREPVCQGQTKAMTYVKTKDRSLKRA